MKIGFFGLLTILFIGLKLSGHIDWSWWWVLAPMWAPIAALITLIFIGVSCGASVNTRRW